MTSQCPSQLGSVSSRENMAGTYIEYDLGVIGGEDYGKKRPPPQLS